MVGGGLTRKGRGTGLRGLHQSNEQPLFLVCHDCAWWSNHSISFSYQLRELKFLSLRESGRK